MTSNFDQSTGDVRVRYAHEGHVSPWHHVGTVKRSVRRGYRAVTRAGEFRLPTQDLAIDRVIRDYMGSAA